MRPLIKALKGMLTVSFVGGCRLTPVSDHFDGGHYGPDAQVADASGDADASADAGSDAQEQDATDAAATD